MRKKTVLIFSIIFIFASFSATLSSIASNLICRNHGRTTHKIFLPEFGDRATVISYWMDHDNNSKLYWKEKGDWDLSISSWNVELNRSHRTAEEPWRSRLKPGKEGKDWNVYQTIYINREDGSFKVLNKLFDNKNNREALHEFTGECSLLD